jgi:hypothetical protein
VVQGPHCGVCAFARKNSLASHSNDVFGKLLYEKRLREDELRGLQEDKLNSIRSVAQFLAKYAA